jgi:hypothetical protein
MIAAVIEVEGLPMLAATIALILGMAPPVDMPGTDVLQVDYPAKGGQVVLYDGEGELVWLSQRKLSGDAATEFNGNFQAYGYFGAFAMSPDGGYGYAGGTGTIEAARDIAMAQCSNLNTGCEIIAEIIPAGFTGTGPQDITLSYDATVNYTAPDRGGFKAMAISEDGAFSMGWDYPSQAEVNAYVLSDCEAQRMVIEAPLRPMPCILLPGL